MNATVFFRNACAMLLAAGLVGTAKAAGGIVVIANTNVVNVDATTLQKIYTGRVVELNGVPVTAVNAGNSTVRARFLQSYMNEDENTYVAYWIKRKYAGLGIQPRELASGSAVINYVKATPGAIGYVDESELEPGVNVLMR
jgi:ABC-type phosphate transport system substrate-binding protein